MTSPYIVPPLPTSPAPGSVWVNARGDRFVVAHLIQMAETCEPVVVYRDGSRLVGVPHDVWEGTWVPAAAPPPVGPPAGRVRRSAVLRQQTLSPHYGCCARYADRTACDCLGRAENDLPAGVSDDQYCARLRAGLNGFTGCGICNNPDCPDPGGKH